MEATYQLLLSLLGRALFGNRATIPQNTDWPALYKEACSQTVQLLVFDCLTENERSAMPADILAAWRQNAFRTLWYNEQLAEEQRQVLAQLAKADIPCVILKGSSSAMCYPKPELRLAGDIDLLVSPHNLDQAQKLIENLGYTTSPEPHSVHKVMHRGQFHIELHFKPCALPHSNIGDSLCEYFLDIEQLSDGFHGSPILPPCHQAILLLLHKLSHLTTSGMGLRQLCDWAAFVHKKIDTNLWDELSKTLERFGLSHFAKVITRVCVDGLGLPKEAAPWCMNVDHQLCRELLADILHTGNFGRKENRYGQRLFTDTGSGGRLASFFRTGLNTCRTHWPICQKYPILLPVAPVVLLTKYSKQRSAGNRPAFHPISAFRGAAQRKKLYESLRPFVQDHID